MNVISEVTLINNPAVKVQYGGCQLVPAPLVDMTVDSVFDDSGERTANTTRIVLTGTVLILPSGSYEQMYTKQEALRSAFASDNLDFTIVAGPGNKTLAEDAIICSGLTPKVLSVNVSPDVHVTRFDYTVELEDSTAASGVSGVVSSFSNQWSFQEDQETCTLQVQHTVSAEGLEGEADAFDQAVRKVKAELGINKLPIQLPCFAQPNASGGFGITHPSNPAGGPIFEVSSQREETADVANGSYSVTETFVLVSGVPFYFKSRNAAFSEDENGIATVTIDGTVQGLGRTTHPGFGLEGGPGYSRACSGWINRVRPQIPWDASGVYLKYKSDLTGSGLILTNPQAVSVTENKCRGTIDFSFTYTDDPSARLPSGISSFSCNVNRVDAIRQFSSHPIPLRRLGPVIQDIKTTTEGTVTIQCQAQSKNTGNQVADTNRAIQYIQDELNRLRAIHANSSNFITLRVTGLNQTNSDRDLSASAQVTYTFTVDLASVLDVDSDIALEMLPT